MPERRPANEVVREVLRLRAGGASPQDELAAVQSLGYTPAEIKAEVEAAPPGFLSSIVQGVTFGFGDELRGAVRGGARALVGGEDFGQAYDSELARSRIAQERFQAGNPVSDAALQVGGGVLGAVATGGLGGLARGAASLPGAAARGLATGAASGAAYGAGSGEGGRDRLARSVVGGVTGGAVGGVLAPVAEAIGRGAALQTPQGARGVARASIADAIADEGLTPARAADEIAAANAAGKTGVTLADVAQGGRIGGILRDVAQSPNPSQARVRNVLESRQRGQFDRVVADLGELTGVGARRSLETSERLLARRSEEAGPLFERAYRFDTSASPQARDAFQRLMSTDAGPRAYARASIIARNEQPGFPVPPMESLVDEATGELRAVPNMRFMQFLKMGLDGLYKSARSGNEAGLDPIIAESIKGVRNNFRDALKAANPDYRTALDRFAGRTALDDAIEEGREAILLAPEQFGAALRGLSASEREMFRIGAVSKLAEVIGKGKRGPTADFTAQLRTINFEQKLPLLIGDPRQADAFARRLGLEEAFSGTARRAAGNSSTSEGRELAELASGSVAGGEAVSEALRAGGPTGFLASLVKATLGRIADDVKVVTKRRFRQEAGDVLTRQDADAEAFLRGLDRRPPAPAYNAPRATVPATIGAEQALLPDGRRRSTPGLGF